MSLLDQLLEPLRGPKPTPEEVNSWNIHKWHWMTHECSKVLLYLKKYNIRPTANEVVGLKNEINSLEHYQDEEVVLKAYMFDKLYNNQ